MTAQEVLDLARVPLNDADKDRYKDTDLLRFLNVGLRTLKKNRPDLFIGTLATPFVNLALGDTLPTPDHIDQAIADAITARAMTVDTEDSERVGAFFALAQGQL